MQNTYAMSSRICRTAQTICLTAALICQAQLASAQDENTKKVVPSVTVDKVVEADVTPAYQFVGRVEAIDTVELRARIEGIIVERNFIEGRIVNAGQKLFVIEKEPYEVVVDQREAEVVRAEAEVERTKADFTRKDSLRDKDVVSEAVLDRALADLKKSEADVLKAKAELRSARLDLGYTEITAPITGRVNEARYSVGNLVNPSSQPLATVTSVNPIYVKIPISEKQLIDARRDGLDLENPPVAPTIILADGSEYGQEGKFDYLAPNVDRSTDTVLARAVFPNPKEVLLPGQFVTVVVRPKQIEKALVVPQAAVQKDREGSFVLVVDRENKIEVRRITLGRQSGRQWVVEHGLASGELVVVEGLQKVKPDMTVNPVPAEKG